LSYTLGFYRNEPLHLRVGNAVPVSTIQLSMCQGNQLPELKSITGKPFLVSFIIIGIIDSDTLYDILRYLWHYSAPELILM